MRVTYIRQSSFTLEWENCVWLFDYFAGEIPALPREKKLVVFASHGHKDHFSPDLFVKTAGHPRSEYLLSDDIPNVRDDYQAVWTQEQKDNSRFLAPHQTYTADDGAGGMIRVETLRSSDQGIAFIIHYAGKVIYHAGDLHWWIWEGESEEEARYMKDLFFTEIEPLRGRHIDLAFLVLDPRLADADYAKGFDVAMNMAEIDAVIPMHYWSDPAVNERFLNLECAAPYKNKVYPVMAEGQVLSF